MAPLPATGEWRLIDPGAGVGSLTAALVARWLVETDLPTMSVFAYEIDADLLEPLEATLREARALAARFGRRLETKVLEQNFVLRPPAVGEGNIVLMNPPYKKLGVQSDERSHLARGTHPVRVTNLYAAFLVSAIRCLSRGDGLVAITPRSFANGPYFSDLRSELLEQASFRQIHVFGARNRVFADSEVLQENIIFSMRLDRCSGDISITTSRDAIDAPTVVTRHPDQIIHPSDPLRFIRLPLDEEALSIAERMTVMPCGLPDLGCNVSTGRVVDFRSREHLRDMPDSGTAPLIYPQNLCGGRVEWPVPTGKPQALVLNDATTSLLLPNEHYVLVKRFSAKEEPRRVVAAVVDPDAFAQATVIAFENHLNVFHVANKGLTPEFASGLAAYLNSRFVDEYVRQFSGHTQINATDLRALRYPTATQICKLGVAARELFDPMDPNALNGILDSIVAQSVVKKHAIAA
jgi:adenine-specific DNA-methyltransferase